MTDQIARALAARIRALDWAYQYTDDYTVYCQEKRKIEAMRHELSQLPVELNREILNELIKGKGTHDNAPVPFMEMIIVKQLMADSASKL
jgi:hypothetical protein